MRNDPDPEGWKAFMAVIGDGTDANKGDQGASYIKFLEKVGAANPNEATLQFKLLKFFIRLNKGDAAIKSIYNLIYKNPTHILTHRGVPLFETFSQRPDLEINKTALALQKSSIDVWKGTNGKRDQSEDKSNLYNAY